MCMYCVRVILCVYKWVRVCPGVHNGDLEVKTGLKNQLHRFLAV